MAVRQIPAMFSLRDVTHLFGVHMTKALSQNFITDPTICDRIARGCGDLHGKVVLEVGPGPGGLTRSLLNAGAAYVVGVEKDRRCAGPLDILAKVSEKRFKPMYYDILELDEAMLLGKYVDLAQRKGHSGEVVLAGNLPFNISVPLLIKYLRQIASGTGVWGEHGAVPMNFMFQKEVADRITAPHGSDSYGRLSVTCQHYCSVKRRGVYGPTAFRPAPNVSGSVVQFQPRSNPISTATFEQMQRFCSMAFTHRRKTLRQGLFSCGATDRWVSAFIDRTGLDLSKRPDEFTVEEVGEMARLWDETMEPEEAQWIAKVFGLADRFESG